MSSSVKCIYNYPETLLDTLCGWNDTILAGSLDNTATNFTDAVRATGSSDRSRAKEMYRIGLLRLELTKGEEGLTHIKNGKNAQSDLGFISSVIAQAKHVADKDSLQFSYSALCSIYSVLQSITIGQTEISLNALIYRLNEIYPCPSDIDFIKWHRYVLSAFLCELKYQEYLYSKSDGNSKFPSVFEDTLTGKNTAPFTMSIRTNEHKGLLLRKTIQSVSDVKDAIAERVSLTDIFQQKMPLFMFGNDSDIIPKGFYGMANKYFSSFLQLAYKFEVSDTSTSSKFKPLFDEENFDSAKTDVLKTIIEIFKSSTDTLLNSEYNKLMKTIYQGAKDALQILQDHSNLNYFEDGSAIQKIFFGAPGTGKSHIIKERTKKESVIRTTFHPDSDYSTFVGAYKPTTKQVTLRDLSGHPVKENGVTLTEDKIIYEFVDQAFLQSYIQAWKYYAEADDSSDPQKQYLIIEEINRGNCAQIFGDLFQLLDRNACGFSDYPINADNDIKKQLAKAFNGLSVAQADRINACYEDEDITGKVLSGEILLLPNNLYIWATMNTSDQSLFPIDSAFKRRWDWQYMPICKGRDENGNELNWKIAADTKEYDWWSFLTKINDHINATTNSEDKKLGFFFCKPQDGCISSETFVGKVIFYLWNDVFKDFGFEGPIFKDVDGSELSFNKFYQTDSKGKAVVQKDKIELFLNNLGVEFAEATENEIDIDNDTLDAGKAEHKETLVAVTINGERLTADGITQFDLYLNAIKKIGVDKIGPALESMKYKRKGSPMATKNKVQGILDSDGYSYVEADGYYFVKGANGYTLVRILEDLNKSLNLNIQIEYR